MSKPHTTSRRSYGSGSLYELADANGRESWYGHWRANGRQVKRKLGLKRVKGTREGLTRAQAEAELRRRMSAVTSGPRLREALTVADLEGRYREYLAQRKRKPATLRAVESAARVWLIPFFGERQLDSIKSEDVDDLIIYMEAEDLAAKSIRNYISTLSSMLSFAVRKRLVATNVVAEVELPELVHDEEIRFLTSSEIERAVAAVPAGIYEALDPVLIRTAAMTGLRAGELVALRWRDVDWAAARLRVRRNYVLGEFGTPKSRRSSRSVPMADAVGAALDLHFQQSRWQGDDDLVFAHPATGEPLSKHQNLRRFRRALKAAGLDDCHRFHDLRHSFGTQMAQVGTPLRTLQEWMGHRDLQTTQRYADFSPSGRDAELIDAAFGKGSVRGSNLSESEETSDNPSSLNHAG